MLLVDAGNTFIKWARFNPDKTHHPNAIVWEKFGAIRHHELSELEKDWKQLHLEKPFRQVLISNVAGKDIGDTLFRFLHTLSPVPQRIDWFSSVPALGGIKNTYQDYKRLGSDRFASMIGAHSLCPNKALVVVTAGTATTIDAISPDGTFLGGMILPGLKLMAESLTRNTAQLPEINHIDRVPKLARDTCDAIISGCLNAQAGAIERTIATHRHRFPDSQCLLSGGAAQYIGPHLSIPYRIIDNLVLIGLYISLAQQPH